MKRWIRAAVVLAILTTAFAACEDGADSEQACTMIGCSTGFAVALQASSWSSGSYQVMINADNRTILCTATLPLPKTSPQSTCNAADVMLGTSGSELPFTDQSLSEVRFSNTLPKQVSIMVSRDATKLAEKTFNPVYETLQPNGPECDPTCTYASATMSW